MPIESRSLRYFSAVARHRSFARAAEELGIASPALSRTVRALESELGVMLLSRTTRSVALTPAGEALLVDTVRALEGLDAAVLRARRAAAPARSVVLAVKADADGGLLDDVLAATSREPGSEPVAVKLCGWGEHANLIRRGEVDAALIYDPHDLRGLDAETIHTEPRVAALPAGHPLGSRDAITLGALGISAESIDRHAERSFGIHPAADLAQLLTLISLGDAAAIVLASSVAARYPRPGIHYVPIADAPPASLVIAWHEDAHSPAIAALVRGAATAGAGRRAPVSD
ncbi:LysR family transcriptional regulator [Microbacterium sp. ARD32]|uniref:LysR family transcriptional regulator n=1 Tax=Microbacterium sp. ARD32 TaxID=2962577 RepID=UPI002881C77E|nr:LysR family transcriptional regulator [Microbacterium sp. ARD32]MDT0156601.1 LysR family transcriptional regulator [Microbacterium sp. ARD32]